MRYEFHISVQEDVLKLINVLTNIENSPRMVGEQYRITLYFNNPWNVEAFCSYNKEFKNVQVLLVDEDAIVDFRKIKGVKYYYLTEHDKVEL